MTSGAPFTRSISLPSAPPVQRGHELVLRFERDGVRPRKRRLFRLPFQPDLGGEGIERSFRRVALHFPRPFLVQQLRIVAKHGNAAHQFQNRVLARRLPVLQNLARWSRSPGP